MDDFIYCVFAHVPQSYSTICLVIVVYSFSIMCFDPYRGFTIFIEHSKIDKIDKIVVRSISCCW